MAGMPYMQRPTVSFYLALAIIVLGFVFLRTPPIDGFLSLTAAPILLVVGYLILIPVGLWPRLTQSWSQPEKSTGSAVFTRTALVGLLVFVAVLVVYLLTLWPGPGWWDSSEYITACYNLAVTGPPGSMFLQLVGRLASFVILISSPAVRINCLTALIAALAIMVVYFTIVRLLQPLRIREKTDPFIILIAAASAALTLAYTHSVWCKATFTNPYILSLLAGSIMMYLAIRWWENPTAPGAGNWLLLAAFLFGLDMSVHRSNILLIPAFVALLLVRRPRVLLNLKLWIGAVLLFVLGLSMQLAVMFRAQLGPELNLGNPDTLRGLWDYLTLSQYGIATFGTDLLQRKAPFWDYQIKEMYLRYMGWNFIGLDSRAMGVRWTGLWALPVLIGLVGFVYNFIREWRQALFLLIAFLCAGMLAIFYLNVPAGFMREMDRHFLVSFMLFAFWIGIGCYAVLHLVPRLLGGGLASSKTVFLVLSFMLVLVLPVNTLVTNWTNNDMSSNRSSEAFGKNLLISCEPDAILITRGDNDTFPPWYLQMVEGFRRDVRVLNINLLNTQWYLRTVMSHYPDVPLHISDDSLETLAVISWETDTVALPPVAPDDSEFKVVVEATFADRYLLIQDQILLNILKDNEWERPICFSMGFGEEIPNYIKDYCRMDGMVWRVVPAEDQRRDYSVLEENLHSRLDFSGLSEFSHLDITGRQMARMYRAAFVYLAGLYEKDGRQEDLDSLNSRVNAFWPTEEDSTSGQDDK